MLICKDGLHLSFLLMVFFAIASCNDGSSDSTDNSNSEDPAAPPANYSLSLTMARIDQIGLDPFTVTATLKKDGVSLPGQTLTLSVPKGSLSSVTDNSDGTYSFTVTPASTGEFPVTISYENASIKRTAVVFDFTNPLIGQPMAVPGEYVNTEGYEDGITITPDGEYLFVQYGPIHFSGVFAVGEICAEAGYSLYSINDCHDKPDSSLVFDSIGPLGNFQRPGFPAEGIADGKLLHLSGIVAPGLVNGLANFPTVFYGFKRQTDGTFAEPFKIAFNDVRGVGGPFGMSFVMNGDGTAKFSFAWNNFFDGNANGVLEVDEAGEDGENSEADVYGGTITLGQDNNLGDLTFISGTDFFESITPNFTPIPFPSRIGVQGNPHLYSESGLVKSIWADSEMDTENISVYRLITGTYPAGTWELDVLPSKIVTAEEEKMPFFTGTKLFMMRGSRIVFHDYLPTNGSCASTYTHDDCWGSEVIALERTTASEQNDNVVGLGEPTIATYDGKNYLYFAYVLRRENTTVIADLNMNAGFVEIPED